MLDVKKVRENFPVYFPDRRFVYLDSASTTQKPQAVVNAVNDYYQSYSANIHRALYDIGERATNEYEQVREKVKSFLNVPKSHSVIFTRGTTESINLVAYAWGLKNLSQNDAILLSEMEHHSNLVPWQIISEYTGASLNYIPLTDKGTLEMDSIEPLLKHTKLVSVGHQSNVFGTVNPVKQIISAARSAGALVVLDGAQAVPHMKVNISELDCDFYAFSGHKMVGPTGVGVLVGRSKLLEDMEPFMGGGEMIHRVTMEKSTWNDVPWKFEAGTPNIAQVIGLGAAIEYLESIGMDTIQRHEQSLLNYGLDILSQNKDITLYGDPSPRGAILPFNVKNIHSHDLAKFLDTDGICIRAGHHCAQPIMNRLGVSATARASLYIYNDAKDIDLLAKSIEKTAHLLA